jgi:DNA-binding transcriptional ArsR family regulator
MKEASGRKVAWERLLPHLRLGQCDTKLHIVEALAFLDQPMSPVELAATFGGADISNVAYHVRTLAESGVLSLVEERESRGARQTFYELSEMVLI